MPEQEKRRERTEYIANKTCNRERGEREWKLVLKPCWWSMRTWKTSDICMSSVT